MAKKDDLFNDDNLIPNNWVKFSVIGNHISGTLVAVREMMSQLKPGEKTKVYEIKALNGEFNDTKDKKPIEPAIDIKEGEIWNIGGSFGLDQQMRNVKVGQIIGIKYTEDKPNKDKMKNPTKIKKVYVKKDAKGQPVFDEEWLATQKGSDDIETKDLF